MSHKLNTKDDQDWNLPTEVNNSDRVSKQNSKVDKDAKVQLGNEGESTPLARVVIADPEPAVRVLENPRRPVQEKQMPAGFKDCILFK